MHSAACSYENYIVITRINFIVLAINRQLLFWFKSRPRAPKMNDKSLSLEQQQEQVKINLAAMFRLTADFGWDDTIWNHITARAPGSDHHFYMHRFGLSYDEVCASNLIKVDEEGKVLEGPKDVNTAGFIIHSAIHLHHP